MSSEKTFLAIFLASKTSPRMTAWMAAPEAERQARQKDGIAAWHGWVERHQSVIVQMGAPLGKTKRVSPAGIEDTANEMSAYTVVRAASHEEAARLFENHPHFAVFPGDSVEIMECMPIPTL